MLKNELAGARGGATWCVSVSKPQRLPPGAAAHDDNSMTNWRIPGPRRKASQRRDREPLLDQSPPNRTAGPGLRISRNCRRIAARSLGPSACRRNIRMEAAAGRRSAPPRQLGRELARRSVRRSSEMSATATHIWVSPLVAEGI